MLILLFISLCSLNLNKLSRINPVHQVFVLNDISHLNQVQIVPVLYLHLIALLTLIVQSASR